jgi:hypothetical protein
MTTITDSPLIHADCNETILTIAGTNTVVTDLEAVFTDAEVLVLMGYTDGYSATMTQTIQTEPSTAAANLGMCFKVYDTTIADADRVIDSTNIGGFCVSYASANTETVEMAADSRTVSLMTAA